MLRIGHRGQRSEAAQNRRVTRGAGLRKAGANLTQVERDAVNRLIARDLARIDGDGGGGHRQDESREQRVESAHQHSAGRHVRRFQARSTRSCCRSPQSSKAKREDWTRFSLKVKAYLDPIDPRYNELLKIAEDPDQSLNHVDLGPGDDWRDGQLFFVLTMLLKDSWTRIADSNFGESSLRSTSRSGRADT